MAKYQPGKKIGYLGGGQLARMLSQSAQCLGLEPHVLSPSNQDPAAQVTHYWHSGDLNNEENLKVFLGHVDVATFESEFLDADLLTKVRKQLKVDIFPTPELMGLLQDRKSQKNLFDQHRLPTSLWAAVDSKEDVRSWIELNSLPVVFKKRFFGYDGYGTFVIKTQKQLNQFMEKDWQDNLFIVEKFIPFKKEAAVIVARSRDGSFTHLPFVESFQKDARCDWVKGPMKAPKNTIANLKRFLNKLHYVGVMGVEFFVTNKGYIINEIAPRVHNTGHYSQATDGYSQFDLHNLCLLGAKLPKEIKIKKGFSMVNLIGKGGKTQLKPVANLHWYGKNENRKGRKLGHINSLGSTPSDALKKALKLRKEIQL